MKTLRVLACIIFSIGVFATCGSAFAQTKLPRFESSPCPTTTVSLPPDVKPECGVLVVAQDRSKPDGRPFRLTVAILRVVPPTTEPPLLMIHGGPSGPGGVSGGEGARALAWAPKLRRDIIVYDQRGAGLSEPSLCPEVYLAHPERYLQAKTDKEREDVSLAQSKECFASLRSNGIDPDMFGSEINALDLIDLRKALGISKWDIFGSSYGGRMVQEALRRDGDAIRSVVMHSPSIVAGGSESDMPLTRQRLMEHVFEVCKAQPECSSAFPTFEKDFYTVYEELNRNPLDVTINDARGPLTIRLDGFRFLKTATNPAALRVSKMPLLVKELLNGDRMRAANYLLSGRIGSGVGNNALTELVGCYDGFGKAYEKRRVEVTKLIRSEFRVFDNNLEQCPRLHNRFASAGDHNIVKSNVPALILTAEFDDRTPTAHGKLIASGLKNSYHFELPGVVHGGGIADGCGESIVIQFLRNPSRRPDAACLATMPRVQFELKSLESQTLYFDIASGDGKPSSFTGSWGAVYPGMEIAVRFALKASGEQLTGSYRGIGGRPFEILDGTIRGDTISFKIKNPVGDRTITFTGKLRDDEIEFERVVEVRPGGRPGGAFIWGSGGPKTFTATRVQ